jgi:hypothetical protein
MIPPLLDPSRSTGMIEIGNGASTRPTAAGATGSGQPAGAGHALPLAIADAFVAEILKPYRTHARYLKSAEIAHVRDTGACNGAPAEASLVTATGRFSIPESCYIDDTGHFNAVEFNICYNQLAYVLFGKCVEAGILQKLVRGKASIPSFAEFMQHQLPSMLIVRIDGVRFLKQMRSDDFRAELRIDKFTTRGPAWFFFTSITFSDCEGVKAEGSVVLAFSPNYSATKH